MYGHGGRHIALRRRQVNRHLTTFSRCNHNLIQIQNATFYHEHPSSTSGSDVSTNPPYFQNLTFTLPATPASDGELPVRKDQHWAVIGAHDTTTFLEVLRGNLLCLPPKARTYPYLSSDEIASKDPRLSLPSRAIQYVGFNSKNAKLGAAAAGLQGAYLSARYESRREETDWTVLQYLKGDTELNPSADLHETLTNDDPSLKQVIEDLKMEKLLGMPVSNLSNGQTRRSRIAKALLSKPELLLLDEPFMGLDPPTLVRLSPMLRGLAYRSNPLLLMALRPQDPIPNWISHLVVLGGNKNVAMMGGKEDILFRLSRWADLYKCGGVDADGEQWLEIMERLYGPPLTGVGDTLTDSGIESYTVYDQVKEHEKKYFDGSRIRSRVLNLEQQKRSEAASQKPVSQRTVEDWFTLVASLPADWQARDGGGIGTRATYPSPSLRSSTSTPKVPASQPDTQSDDQDKGEPLIELENLVLKYGDKTILGHPPPQPGFTQPGLNLTLRRGTRMALLGPNGSGKTTLLSLLTSDHPQSYSLPLKFFGRTRLPSKGTPGLSLWEIQKQIGHSSPEVHAFFPKRMTIRRVLESSWAETFSSNPEMTAERTAIVDEALRWWEPELRQSSSTSSSSAREVSGDGGKESASKITSNDYIDSDISWATSHAHPFATLPFGTQRLLLLLRALIKQPSIIILDEAFSGLNPTVRDKAMDFLHHGTTPTTSRPDPHSKPDPKSSESSVTKTGIATTSTNDNQTTVKIPGLSRQQALVVVSHLREEIPECITEWMRLPSEEEALEFGKGVEMGRIEEEEEDAEGDSNQDPAPEEAGKGYRTTKRNKKHGIKDVAGWNRVWGL